MANDAIPNEVDTDRAGSEVAAVPLEAVVEHLRAMLDAGPHESILVSPEFRLLSYNGTFREGFRARFGRDPVLSEDFLECVTANQRNALEAAMAAAKEGRETVFEDRCDVARSEPQSVEVYVAPFLNEAGHLAGLCLTSWPIDDRKGAELALRAREGQLHVAMEVGRIVPWEWHIEQNLVTRALDIPIVGPPPKSLEMFLAFVHPEDRPLVESAIEATLKHDAPYSIVYRKVVENTVSWIDARARLVRDEGGRPVKLVGVVVDITERRRLEEQLLQAQKMEAIGRLAGGVAHDFNNILTSILLCARRLGDREDLESNPEVADILAAAERAAALTHQLLAFGRRQMLQPSVLDLNDVVREMTSMVRRIVGEDIELHALLAPEPARVRGDVTQLQQVLLNLVVNARDAMPTGGHLHVTTENIELSVVESMALSLKPGRYVRLRIRDTGQGMDEATKSLVFEPFFTTKGPGFGTGLGLSTSYGVIVQLGGAMTVSSERDRGATFDVLLPAAPGGVDVREEAPRGPQGRGSETVLLVEDEPGVRRLTRRVLEDEGYTVLEAEDGLRAVDIARSHGGPIHVLVTDVVMPRLGGMATAQRVREIVPSARVLFVSGYTDDAVTRHGVASEALLLRKPYSPEALAAAIRGLLDQQA